MVSEIPIAFIDVDGVLNRVCSNSVAKKRGLFRHHGWAAGTRWGLWLDPADRGRIERLAEVFEPAWGTTWEQDAHASLAVPLGLDRFEIVAITNLNEGSKSPGVVRAAEGRPFVWFDDVHQEIVADQHHLLIPVDPEQGLTDENIDTAIEWWAEVSEHYDDYSDSTPF